MYLFLYVCQCMWCPPHCYFFVEQLLSSITWPVVLSILVSASISFTVTCGSSSSTVLTIVMLVLSITVEGWPDHVVSSVLTLSSLNHLYHHWTVLLPSVVFPQISFKEEWMNDGNIFATQRFSFDVCTSGVKNIDKYRYFQNIDPFFDIFKITIRIEKFGIKITNVSTFWKEILRHFCVNFWKN